MRGCRVAQVVAYSVYETALRVTVRVLFLFAFRNFRYPHHVFFQKWDGPAVHDETAEVLGADYVRDFPYDSPLI